MVIQSPFVILECVFHLTTANAFYMRGTAFTTTTRAPLVRTQMLSFKVICLSYWHSRRRKSDVTLSLIVLSQYGIQ